MPFLSAAVAAGGFLFAPMVANGALATLSNIGPTRLEVAYEAITPVPWIGRQTTASATLTADLSANRYRVAANAKLEGVVDWFADASVAIVSTGSVTALGLVPGRYDSSTKDGAKNRHVIVDFMQNEVAVIVRPKFGDWGFPAPTQPQKLEAMDPLAALMELTLRIDATPANPCGGPLRIFDGKERYDLRLKFVRRLQWNTDVYRGPAIKCDITYIPIAGFDPKSAQQKAEDKTDLEWANFILAELDGGDLTPPIKAELRSRRSGKYTIQATRLKYGLAR